jgi:hypothetical protein
VVHAALAAADPAIYEFSNSLVARWRHPGPATVRAARVAQPIHPHSSTCRHQGGRGGGGTRANIGNQVKHLAAMAAFTAMAGVGTSRSSPGRAAAVLAAGNWFMGGRQRDGEERRSTWSQLRVYRTLS